MFNPEGILETVKFLEPQPIADRKRFHKNAELGSDAAHHNTKYDMDEKALALGVGTTLQFAKDFMAK